MAYGAMPRFGLVFSSALRACNSCTAGVACAEWLAETRDTTSRPPRFCASVDLLWDLLCDPTIGHRTAEPNHHAISVGETAKRNVSDF
jgi:hypothetical protein